MLRIFSRLNIGGPSVHVILLSAGLRPLGYETRLVVGRESPREGNMLALAAEKNVTCEAMAGLGREIAPLSDLRALVGPRAPDARVAAGRSSTRTPPRPGCSAGSRRARRACPTVVHTYHGHVLRGYFSPAKTALFRWLETRLARARRRARGGLRGGEAGPRGPRHRARREDPRDPARPRARATSPGALPRGVLRREAGIPDDAPLVGMVGRLVPIKDVPDVPAGRAARRASARPDVRFALVGDGEERPALEALCRELGLDGAVHVPRLAARPRRGLRRPRRGRERLAQRGHAGGAHRGAGGGAAGRGDPRGRDAGPPRRGRARAGSSRRASPRRSPGPSWRRSIESEAARRRAQAGREHVLARHSSDRLVRDVDALYRELRAAKKAA